MKLIDQIRHRVDYYKSTYPDYEISNGEIFNALYDETLDEIPLVHEFAHELIGIWGGDDNYEFFEMLAIAVQVGMMRNLYLLDRNLDDYFLAPPRNRINLTDDPINRVFHPNGTEVELDISKKKRYPASIRVGENGHDDMLIYALLASDFLSLQAKSLNSDLLKLGDFTGSWLRQKYVPDVIPFNIPTGFGLEYYPEITEDGRFDELTKILIHNEREFRSLLIQMDDQNIRDLAQEVEESFPEIIHKLRHCNALFAHIVLGYSARFCVEHFKLIDGFTEEFIIWEKKPQGYKFDVTKARAILMHYIV